MKALKILAGKCEISSEFVLTADEMYLQKRLKYN